MPGDAFLKIKGIEGECQDKDHEKEIDVDHWQWGMAHPVSWRGGGLSGGETTVSDLVVTKPIDKSSPNIMKYCLSAKTMDEVLLTLRKRGDKPIEFFKVKLTNAMISQVSPSGSGGNGAPTSENVGFVFEKVEVEYTPQKSDGQPDAAVKLAWNVKQNAEA